MDTAPMRKEAETTEIANQSGTSASQLRKIDVVSNRIESRDLFVATKEITIGHEGEVYRLRLTALNKLILTK
jgi:hemin uptake protein HemP